MKALLRCLLAIAIAAGTAACTASYYMPNVIELTPSGSSSNPAKQTITASFTLIAVEDGYTGDFTAQTSDGTCWVVQTPITTSGAWTVVPQGSSCSKLGVEKIQVKDQKGNSAVTYIQSVQ